MPGPIGDSCTATSRPSQRLERAPRSTGLLAQLHTARTLTLFGTETAGRRTTSVATPLGTTLLVAVMLLAMPALATQSPAPRQATTPAAKVVAHVSTTLAQRAGLMTDKELVDRRGAVHTAIRFLEGAARQDLTNRLHRMAYEKYRRLESLKSENVVLLGEVKRREPVLNRRIRLDRQQDELKTDVEEVRRMVKLLRMYAIGS